VFGSLATRLRICWTAVVLYGCATAGRATPPAFTTGTWRVRIDVDSAPTRRLLKQQLLGTIDFATGRYAIDFQHSFNSALPNGAYVAPTTDASASPAEYKITLGDSSSFDNKIVMRGRLIGRDSIVGTWSETVICCSAGGRFSLWRAPPPALLR
jgi:hypothetical protein